MGLSVEEGGIGIGIWGFWECGSGVESGEYLCFFFFFRSLVLRFHGYGRGERDWWVRREEWCVEGAGAGGAGGAGGVGGVGGRMGELVGRGAGG